MVCQTNVLVNVVVLVKRMILTSLAVAVRGGRNVEEGPSPQGSHGCDDSQPRRRVKDALYIFFCTCSFVCWWALITVIFPELLL